MSDTECGELVAVVQGRGAVPVGWRATKLGKVVNFGNGKIRPRHEGSVPVYGGNGILGYSSESNYDGETIIVGRVGAYCGSVYFSDQPIWVSDNALSAKPKNSHNTKFLYYFLKNLNLNQRAQGSSHPLITQTLLNSLDVSICEKIGEQKDIAEVLGGLDDKVDLLRRQNKTLEAIAQTLFRKWFVEDADDGWEKGKLADEFDIVMGQSPPGTSYNEDGDGMPMFQGNADFGFRFPANRIYTTAPKKLAEKFDTLISVRAPVGAQNMAQFECCIGRGVAAFRYRENKSFCAYTYYKLMSLASKIKRFDDTGTVFGAISKGDFESMEVSIPPYGKIEDFQNRFRIIDDKIACNQAQIRTLAKLRDMLLPKLISGAIRVH